MNFELALQAASPTIQSIPTAIPPIPATPIQNRTSLPIPEAVLIDLELLDHDYATS